MYPDGFEENCMCILINIISQFLTLVAIAFKTFTKVELIFRRRLQQGVINPDDFDAKCTHSIQTRQGTCYHQFLTDCLQTFTKVGLIFRDDPLTRGNRPYVFEQNCTFSSISQSILNGLPSNLHKVGLPLFEIDREQGVTTLLF